MSLFFIGPNGKGISLLYYQGIVTTIDSEWSKFSRYDIIWFKRENPLNLTKIQIYADGTIEINWQIKWQFSPRKALFEPDGTIKVEWKEKSLSHSVTKTIYDKQGNLLYMKKELPSGNDYIFELLSPGTYSVYPYSSKNIEQWIYLVNNSKIVHTQ